MDPSSLFSEIAALHEQPKIASSKVSIEDPKKSFIQALNGICDIPSSQLLQSIIKGDRLLISIPEEEYKTGLQHCKNNLHDSILWPKGDMPPTVFVLWFKPAAIWYDMKNQWVFFSLSLSLTKGYYEFMFVSAEDIRRVRASGTLNLNPSSLKLFS